MNTFNNQAFTLVGGFSGAAAEATLAYDSGLHATLLSLDTDGDANADAVIRIHGNVTAFADIMW